MKIESIFTDIFKNNTWGSAESVSGTGSTIYNTEVLRNNLKSFIESNNIKTIIDSACGDFNWMRLIVQEYTNINFIGLDIVKPIIDRNTETYKHLSNVKFFHKNMLIDQLPDGDLVICRDVLGHLTTSDIKKYIRNVKKSNIKYIGTTHFINVEKNSDIKTGEWQPINANILFGNSIYSICEQSSEAKDHKYFNIYEVKNIPDIEPEEIIETEVKTITNIISDQILDTEVTLSVGMAVHDHFDGVYFTVQSILMGETPPDEIIIIDNAPDTNDGKLTKSFCESANQTKNGKRIVKYVEYTQKKSTCVKEQVFNHATTSHVMVVDSHVILKYNTLTNIMKHFKENPDNNDLYHGVITGDNVTSLMATEMKPVYSSHFYGQWHMDHTNVEKGVPFEIEMHGMALFACRKDAWLGFDPRFIGFGGEEGYIHQKFRNNGRKVWCLPNVIYNHQFKRSKAATYPNILEDRLFNYILGWYTTGIDTKPLISHFIEKGMTQKQIDLVIHKVRQVMTTQERKDICITRCPNVMSEGCKHCSCRTAKKNPFRELITCPLNHW